LIFIPILILRRTRYSHLVLNYHQVWQSAGSDVNNGINLSGFQIEVNGNDVDAGGNFSEDSKKELKKGGLTNWQIEMLGQEAQHCRNSHWGAKLICSSIGDPKEPNPEPGTTQKHKKCCLSCECRTGNNDGTGSGTTIICDDSWHWRPSNNG